MSNPILSESPSLTAPAGLQAALALEPMPDSLLPPDALEVVRDACRILYTSGHEPLFRQLLDIGSWIEQQQQQPEETP